MPRGVSLVDAAGLPEVACTVWSNVFLVANIQPGQVLLVHGGSSGIGTMAIQLAKAVGAHVAVTAGSQAKLDVCRDLGAEFLVNYREEDFVERVRELTKGHGADVILDNMGAKYLARNVEALAISGRLVTIGLMGGRKGELDMGMLLAKRAAVIATSLRARPATEKAAIVAAVREHVWPLIESGAVSPSSTRATPSSTPPRRTARWRPRATSARSSSPPDAPRPPGRPVSGRTIRPCRTRPVTHRRDRAYRRSMGHFGPERPPITTGGSRCSSRSSRVGAPTPTHSTGRWTGGREELEPGAHGLARAARTA